MFEAEQIIRWRSENRLWATQKIETEFPALLDQIENEISNAGLRQLVIQRSKFLKLKIAPLVEAWQKKQLARLRHKLENSLNTLTRQAEFSDATSEVDAKEGLLTGAGIASSVGPLVALPIIGSSVAIGTSGILFFSAATVTISWPILGVGVAVLGTTALSRGKTRAYFEDKRKKKLLNAIEKDLRRVLLERREGKKDQSFLSAILLEIDGIAQAKISEAN